MSGSTLSAFIYLFNKQRYNYNKDDKISVIPKCIKIIHTKLSKTVFKWSFIAPKISTCGAIYELISINFAGEYEQNLCDSKNSSCKPCKERLPDCLNKQDGQQAFPKKLWQNDYIICAHNRTISVDKCKPLEYFNPRLLKCMERVEPGIYDTLGYLYFCWNDK